VFFKKKEVDKHAKKIDKLITWLIIWWAVASMIWLSKTDKWKEIQKNVKIEWKKAVIEWKSLAKKWYNIFWKVLVWTIKIFNKK
jgi:hypothetical protein